MTCTKLAGVCLALTVFTLVSGCSKKENANWLLGEWIFDGDMTTANLPPEAKTAQGALLMEQLMAQADNGTISFTATQATFTTPSSTGTSGYSILEQPDATTLVIKAEDGRVTTFTRSGEFLILSSSGEIQFNSYFRRKT